MDRTLASGAESVGSTPAERTTKQLQAFSDFIKSLGGLFHFDRDFFHYGQDLGDAVAK